jgi:hypothetical protein
MAMEATGTVADREDRLDVQNSLARLRRAEDRLRALGRQSALEAYVDAYMAHEKLMVRVAQRLHSARADRGDFDR